MIRQIDKLYIDPEFVTATSNLMQIQNNAEDHIMVLLVTWEIGSERTLIKILAIKVDKLVQIKDKTLFIFYL